MQENITIGDIVVPTIVEGGERYYPISYITTKILLRSNKNGLVHKRNREECEPYLNKFVIKFGDSNIQESNCISEDCLKRLLEKTQQGRLSVEQRESQNHLHKHLGIDLLTTREQIIHKLDSEHMKDYDRYTLDIIKSESDDTFQLCSSCEKYYPLSNIFFNPDTRKSLGYNGICHVCTGRSKIFRHPDKDRHEARLQREEYFEALKDGNVIKIYELYLRGEIKRLPDCYHNREDYLKIIKHLYDTGRINRENLKADLLNKTYKLTYMYNHLSIHDVYSHLFGNDYFYYPWKYKNIKYREVELTYGIANKIVGNYLEEFGETINDIFTYDYDQLVRNTKITKLAQRDLLYFVVQYHEFKYPGYYYKFPGVNYYKDDENVMCDLKYLIEQDMKIPVDKIPLYLTKNVLQKKCLPLYRQIVTNKNRSIYEWVDILYPEKFIETDFELNAYRNEFDSDTECFIHEILKEKFSNVLYNPKHTDRTITLDGMIPDWFVFTSSGVWIIEYFGLYVERQKDNSRVRDYIEKTHRKIERYDQMEGYKFIYLYPEDIESEYFGCREKLREIEESIGAVRD